MKIYMLWTISGAVVGKVDDEKAIDYLPNPVRLYKPLKFVERPMSGPLNPASEMQVGLAFMPMLLSAYVPWVDVSWVINTPVTVPQLIQLYEKVTSDLQAQAAGLVIANPGQVPPTGEGSILRRPF